MPLVTSTDANRVVARAAADAFIKEANSSPIGQIKAEYEAFLGTLSQGAQKEFDGFVSQNAPDVASLLQLAPKLAQQDFAVRSDAVWRKHFAFEDKNKAVFTAVFGDALLKDREWHQMGATLKRGANDEVVAELTVWKPADRQPALGFVTEGLGSATLQFANDGTFKVLSKTP